MIISYYNYPTGSENTISIFKQPCLEGPTPYSTVIKYVKTHLYMLSLKGLFSNLLESDNRFDSAESSQPYIVCVWGFFDNGILGFFGGCEIKINHMCLIL